MPGDVNVYCSMPKWMTFSPQTSVQSSHRQLDFLRLDIHDGFAMFFMRSETGTFDSLESLLDGLRVTFLFQRFYPPRAPPGTPEKSRDSTMAVAPDAASKEVRESGNFHHALIPTVDVGFGQCTQIWRILRRWRDSLQSSMVALNRRGLGA